MMRALGIALCCLAVAGPTPTATYWHGAHNYKRPDPSVTPGAVGPYTEAEVCAPGFLAAHEPRVSSRLKAKVYATYGRVKDATCCEVDHLVPRELGGLDVFANLWPQDWHEARIKDAAENIVRYDVCVLHLLTLTDAQHAFETDWTGLVP